MKSRNWLLGSLLLSNSLMAQVQYPQSRKMEQTDTYFGTTVSDPYRWLENDTSAETKAWVQAQNETTNAYLEKIPYRAAIRKKLEDLMNYPKYGIPVKAGDYYLFSLNNGLQNQAVYYRQKGLKGEKEVFLDPNTYSKDGTVAVGLSGISKDKKYVVLSIQRSGSDWQELEVMEIATGKKLSDRIEWAKFTGAAWDDKGFYYSRYDAPAEGLAYSAKNEYHKVYYHKLGTSQKEDVLIYQDKDHPLRYHSLYPTEDGRYLILSSSEGTDGSEVLIRDMRKPGMSFDILFPGFKHNYTIIDNEGDDILAVTNLNAPNYRLVKVDPKNPDPAKWVELIPEKPELLDAVSAAGGKLVVTYLKDVCNRVYLYSRKGKMEQEIAMPALGTVAGFGGEKEDTEVFFSFTSFTFPPTVYSYSFKTKTSSLFAKPDVKFNPDDYVIRQEFYTSKDGTRVPMFIVHRKGLSLNGQNPTYLYGYGGFNINLTPNFSTSRLAWLEMGGVFAMPSLRGGGEYGEKWHRAGMLLRKQTVFDDFISAAEYLIEKKYTDKNHLAIAGGSNGGLLVGACLTQRPDLFRVAIPAVGVLDMLRFHKFTIGWGWVVEYGSSERSKEEFENLLSYSPYHNVKAGTSYPSIMVTTADHDDRVVPAHSFKFAARLQELNASKNPMLIRIETKAGHGAGKSISKLLTETADVYSFIFHEMGFTPLFH